jgi:hypothetical protein
LQAFSVIHRLERRSVHFSPKAPMVSFVSLISPHDSIIGYEYPVFTILPPPGDQLRRD